MNDETFETWKPVSGYEGWYEVSDLGRVRSVDRVVVRKDGRVRRFPAGIRTAPIVGSGYRALHLAKNGLSKQLTVHRLVCEAFHGTPEEGQIVRHLDDDRLNNLADNLTWGSQSDNMLDAVRNGHHAMPLRERCPTGHEYSESNTYVSRNRRNCRRCARDKHRNAWRMKNWGSIEKPSNYQPPDMTGVVFNRGERSE